ncbi:Meiotically up-regulated gene 80 protein [Metarhizium anisopliae]
MPGGVCAVLDYEVDVMAEYVSEMAVRVVTPDATITSGFRKFVTQILTSTRLPSTTILLGMNYLAKRINAIKGQGPYKVSEGQVAEFDRYQAIKAQQQTYRSRDAPWAHNPWNAPLTPPDSGYGTPEYVMSATSSNARYNEWFAQAAAQYSSRYPQPPAHSSFYQHRQTPYSSHYSYNHGGWDHGIGECNCPGCVGPMKQTPYFVSHGYGQQVVG